MRRILHELRCLLAERYLYLAAKIAPKNSYEELAAVVAFKIYIYACLLKRLGYSDQQVIDQLIPEGHR